MLIGTRLQHKIIAIALSEYLDRTLLNIHQKARSEMNHDIIYYPLAKKVQQDMAHHLLYNQLTALHLILENLKKSARTMRLYTKYAHTLPPSFSIALSRSTAIYR